MRLIANHGMRPDRPYVHHVVGRNYRMGNVVAAITRLGVPPTLARTLRSTNSIESMIEICRDHATNVKRWQDGQMVLRWIAAGMSEARKQFRRVNGHLHLPALRTALDATITAVTPSREDAA